MKTYVNKNNSEWKAYQRKDGNYNCKIDNKSYHTVKLKEQIEGSSDWVLFTDWYRYKIAEYLGKELSQLDDLVWGKPPQPKQKEQKPQGILSVRVGDKKYKLGQEYKGGKITSFFTNNGDIWLSLNCGDQYKL
jgi:hypothetical protein